MTDKLTITENEVKKVAKLARLRLEAEQLTTHVKNLNHILELIAEINQINTDQVTPMASPLEGACLSWRKDKVTEADQRILLQKLAPAVESGLYLVPQVIE